METRQCEICLEYRPLKKFSRNRARGKVYGYHKKCSICLYEKYFKSKKYGKRFKWSTATEEEKFKRMSDTYEKYVIRQNGCWNWRSFKDKNGYGEMAYQKTTNKAHRISWMIYNGSIPDGMYVLHKCDNPPCSNPDHLFLGDAGDNRRDCRDKGRMPIRRGEKSNFCKLKEEQVKEIKKLLTDGLSQYEIGRKFNVSRGAICDIKRGRNWKHVVID